MLGLSSVSETPLSALPAVAPVVSTKIAGYTRDRCGPVKPNCTLTLFRTSDNIPVASTTSSAGGYYEFVNPVGGPFYIVVFDATGALAGVSRKDLMPA